MSQKYTLVSGSVLLSTPPLKLVGSRGGHNAMGKGRGRRYNLPVWTQSTSFVSTEVGSGKVYHVIVRGQTELSFSQAEQTESVR